MVARSEDCPNDAVESPRYAASGGLESPAAELFYIQAMDRSTTIPGRSRPCRARAPSQPRGSSSMLLGAYLATGFLAGGRGAGSHCPTGAARALLACPASAPQPSCRSPRRSAAADPAYRASASGDAVTLATPAQGTNASFESAGVSIGSGALSLGMRLTAVGSPAGIAPVAQAAPVACGNRVSYSRAGVRSGT